MKSIFVLAGAIGLGSVLLQPEHSDIFSRAFVRASEPQIAPAVLQSGVADENREADERARLALQLEAERTEDERRQRDHDWEMDRLRLQHAARMRELDFRHRLARDEAADAQRRKEAELAAQRDIAAEQRQQSEEAVRRALNASHHRGVETRTVIVERPMPVYVGRPVPVAAHAQRPHGVSNPKVEALRHRRSAARQRP